MNKLNASSRLTPSDFKVGRKVLVRMGRTKRRAEVVEDRGPIGVGGRRIVRVRYVSSRTGEPQQTFEVPLDHVTLLKLPVKHSPRTKSRKAS
jgi:hypothetical protein